LPFVVTQPVARGSGLQIAAAGPADRAAKSDRPVATGIASARKTRPGRQPHDASTPAVTYGYDANGNRTSMVDGAGTETYAFDVLNRLTGVTRGSDTFTYGYDAAGNITSRTYPGQTAQIFVYDDGRLTSANGATATYDPAANLLTVTTPDGFTARDTYDRAGRLLEAANTRSSGTLSRFTYTLDAAGNRIAMTTHQGTVTYRYDQVNRLTEACWSQTSCPGGPPAVPAACLACIGGLLTRPAATTNPPTGETYRDYTYDPVGNRLTEVSNAGTTTYAYNSADRLTSATAPGNVVTAYTFDSNGNQTAAGARTFTYDLADRLKSATISGTTETYTYAGDGTRLSAATGTQANKTTKFLWDRAFGLPQLAIERNGNNALLRSYRYAFDRVSQTAGSSTYYYYHPDGLGSVADVTGSTGTALSWAEYYPYGVLRQAGADHSAPAVDPFRFTGKQLDATTGLYYLRARQYDPATGRFLGKDPVSPPITDPYVSTYAYARNNPARVTDPSGRCIGPLIVLCAVVLDAAAGAGAYVISSVVFNAVQGNLLPTASTGATSPSRRRAAAFRGRSGDSPPCPRDS
jgi:RHS repeat-associated protein